MTPEPVRAAKGNAVTAQRWALILRELSHTVTLGHEFGRHRCDLLVALHARRSHAAAARFKERHPERPLIVALSGTDLYQDLPDDLDAQASLDLADRLVVLQPDALRHLPRRVQGKAVSILQSAAPPARRRARRPGAFEVCVLGNLRAVKDPLRTARAARLLPKSSRIQVLHIGEPLDREHAAAVRAEERENPRYTWLKGLPRHRALWWLSGCRLLALTSHSEGGANVVAEALVCGVPVVSSRISGTLGMLGADYPGYFPAGKTRALARLLRRAEEDEEFLADLTRRCAERAPAFTPARERAAWKALLREL